MALILKSNDRGFFDFGWLKTYHSFSFGNYFNPNFMEFGDLRVLNDDIIAPQTGFPLHPHQNMEIVTYILSGTLTHQDSLGNKEEIQAGEVQVMSAGKKIIHSEWNYGDKPCHLLQIWIKPKIFNQEPSYKIYRPQHFEKWGLVTAGEDVIAKNFAENSPLAIKQDAEIFVIDSGNLHEINLPKNLSSTSKIWLHVASGEISFDENFCKNFALNIENSKQNSSASPTNFLLKSGDAIGFSCDESYQEKSTQNQAKNRAKNRDLTAKNIVLNLEQSISSSKIKFHQPSKILLFYLS